MTFNNFGVGFDLGIVYTKISALEVALENNMDNSNKNGDTVLSEKVKIKRRHETSFQAILSKMDNVIQ